ncbi:MAG: serine/threonine-protein kinase [Longimicrobiales bacterium]|nr:serine/threonine-protein kinase [Longimicrobiales bacterium]
MDKHFVRIQTALAGRYSLERELGRGGMGVVYLAHEVALDRPVALKFLPPELTAEDGVRERFLREARTAAKLSHPHIVPIYTVDEVDDFVFFAMAAIDGETLDERVRARGPLTNSEAMRLLKELSWALAYAHAQGVVHRDIKPENILLESGSGRALITDFGIAEVGVVDRPMGLQSPPLPDGGAARSRSEIGSPVSHASVDHGIDRVTQVVGTAEFMSPEQAKGAPVDGRSDLYSLAAVGFFAVSGRAPFEGGKPSEILGRHVAEPAPPLTSVVPGVSPVLAGVVDRCLRKDPERRFLGGESVADALAQEAVFERQLPVPLRVFIKNLRRLTQSAGSLGIVMLLFLGPMFVAFLFSTGLPAAMVASWVLALFAAAFAGSAAWQARKLIKAGFTLEDARLALLEDVNRRNEELRFEVGPRKTGFDAVLNGLTTGLLATALIAMMMIMILGVESDLLWQLFGWTFGGGVLTGLVRAARASRRADLVGERWLRIWSGKIGDLLYAAGGLGLDEAPSSASGIRRSTEVALGLAAARLYEELPRETRRELSSLPETVRRLETDARTLRSQVKELNAVLNELGEDAAGEGADAREKVRRDVEATRNAAEERLREVVAALETIRVGLLRMHAGESVTHSVTMDLETAQGLSGDMDSLLEGHREVERLLARRRATGRITPED